MRKAIFRFMLCASLCTSAFYAHADINLGTMIKNSVKKAVDKNGGNSSDPSAVTPGNYQKLTDTKLKDLFKSYPVTNDENPPAFPKVAIRVTSFSKTLEQWSQQTKSPNECITYTVTLWTDATKSEKFENLRMCAPDLVFDVSFTSVRSPWPVKFNYNENSAQVRNDGPVAPKAPYPTDPVARGLMYGGGVFYFGSLFLQMGYDWDYPHDTMRVWVSGVASGEAQK